uniref:Uncharacterized protein n=1 Tax=Panagrolaimus sp. JU765 TaxID=591449 RepID=A0AC34RBC9_9BILA
MEAVARKLKSVIAKLGHVQDPSHDCSLENLPSEDELLFEEMDLIIREEINRLEQALTDYLKAQLAGPVNSDIEDRYVTRITELYEKWAFLEPSNVGTGTPETADNPGKQNCAANRGVEKSAAKKGRHPVRKGDADRERIPEGDVHVKQGTQIIGVVQLILAIFSGVALLFASELDPIFGSIELASLVVEVLVLVLLFYALKTEKSSLLLPYLIYEGLWILISVVIMILGFFAFLKPQSSIGHLFRSQLIEISVKDSKGQEMEDSLIRLTGLFTILSFLIGTIISSWWIFVVYKCHDYLKQYSAARKASEVGIRYNSKALSA